MAAIILALMAASFLNDPTDVYHSWWFIALWAVAAGSGVGYLAERGVPKRFFTFCLHLSFVVILAGALVTFIWGEKGSLSLNSGETASEYLKEDGSAAALPFSLRLDEFRVEYYPGSKAPSDYCSSVTILPSGESSTISMNKILRRSGYRFYQASFDPGDGSSTLSVSHDPWGIGITYSGYLLLLLSMIGFFFERGSGFRAALGRLSKFPVLLLLLVPQALGAAPAQPKVLPDEVADAFGELYVYYNDRVCPFSTQARDYCLKAYGKARPFGYSAEQVVTGWLFYYDWWRVVPFKVKAKDKGTPREDEKSWLQRSVASGDAMKFYPIALQGGEVEWFDSNGTLPPEVFDNYELWVFVRKAMDLVQESVRIEDWPEVLRLVGKIKSYQEKTAAGLLPDRSHVAAERLWNRINLPKIPFMATITFGLLCFVLLGLRRGKPAPGWLRILMLSGAVILFIYLLAVLGLSWFISGHAPFAGSYNMMMLMSALACLSHLLLWRRFPPLQPLCLLLSGFTMLMAYLSGSNPQITHLMPVLQSPLLSVHVLSMMISYTIFALVALNGVLGLVQPSSSGSLRDLSLVMLYPAEFLLIFGTFLGAVWANISWGSYWSWDPKETWALVTLLVYAGALHGGSLRFLQKPRAFHVYTIVAFACVLFTYFGVNLVLGGMHSYA